MIGTTTYYDIYTERHATKLLPGEYAVTGAGSVIVTVLGSCVAACVRDERLKIGGMNHFMLPGGDMDDSALYGVYAMEVLVNDLLKRGSRREDLSVKAFGGATVLEGMTTLNVGTKNADFIRKFLRDEGLRLIAEDLYGSFPRKIYFFPETGEVRVNYLRELKNDTIVRRERNYAAELQHLPINEVEEFTWPTKSAS